MADAVLNSCNDAYDPSVMSKVSLLRPSWLPLLVASNLSNFKETSLTELFREMNKEVVSAVQGQIKKT